MKPGTLFHFLLLSCLCLGVEVGGSENWVSTEVREGMEKQRGAT